MSESSLIITIKNQQQDTLYQASLEGNVAALISAITSFSETPLHIGHFDFLRALLHHKPKRAQDSHSSRRLPLLHWVSEQSPDRACFSRDRDRRIPLHLAAMKGRIDVVEELIRSSPESIRELHLCVRYNRLDVLKLLVDSTQGHELVTEKDDHGNTVLHLAPSFKRLEMSNYLHSESSDIETNSSDVSGFTALEVEHSPIDSKSPVPSSICRNVNVWWKRYINDVGDRLENARGNILVAATVTASMAFQAGINPPENASKIVALPLGSDTSSYSTLKYIVLPNIEVDFWFCNTMALMISLAIIMLMLSGIPFKNKFSSVLLVYAMQLIVVNIAQAYFHAEASKLNGSNWDNLLLVIGVFAQYVVPLVFLLIIFIHVCTFLSSLALKFFIRVNK
ncbi:ankyrin repeat-containing protein BDA1-like [Euphorbia lathyris]|uniref:ankyrin repeat-containing protein BDA1-like n=1 Tax=Euphorbia lathyris TaxID=212925 RepID=UPI0033142566